MIEKLVLLIDAEDDVQQEHVRQRKAQQEAEAEELDAGESIKHRRADRQRRKAIEYHDAKARKARRDELRDELLRSGSLIAYLLAP